MGFNLMYYFPMCGLYFFLGSNLEKFGKFWKYGRFSGRIRPDWGNTARADMAGLGSIGLRTFSFRKRAIKVFVNMYDISPLQYLFKTFTYSSKVTLLNISKGLGQVTFP